ncbi:MAG: redox-regulated ATPase YchF [Candidatus Woesearchaeota archaeon]
MLIGIIGKANVGKSTFFKALTLSEVEIANYPFATIKPNQGVGYVKIKDVAKEFNKTANPRDGFILEDFRFVPVELLDVAGLVPGAHKGIGLGNQFLTDLNQADALIHVIDISGGTNEKGEPLPENTYNPSEDIRFLELELDMWYLQLIKKGWTKFSKQLAHSKEIHKLLTKQLSGLKVTEDMIKETIKNLPKNPTQWSEKELLDLATQLRIKSKPMIIAANKIDIPNAEENFERIQKEFPNYKIIKCSSESEVALKEAAKKELIDYTPGDNKFKIKGNLNDKQKNALEFINKNILEKFNSTGVQDILNYIVFDLLKYIALHPGGVSKLEDKDGNVIPDCFLMPENTTALEFAYRLHTDFGKNFIKAMDVKTKKPIGKDYKLKHLDIIEIMTRK